jgi:hypothetical protein
LTAATSGDGRALVDLEGRPGRAGVAQLARRGQVGVDVAAAERVDGLLGIADDHQGPGRRSPPDLAGDAPLDRIGVLELVDQRPRQPGRQPTGQAGIGVEGAGGEPQHVVEVDLAAALLLSDRRGRRPRPAPARPAPGGSPGEVSASGASKRYSCSTQRRAASVVLPSARKARRSSCPRGRGRSARAARPGTRRSSAASSGTASCSKARPAANASSARTRWQKPWIVEIGAASTRSRASRSRAAGTVVEGPGLRRPGRRRRAPHHLGQQPADARAQLGGGLVGVGDDDDAIDRGVGAEQEVDDLVLEEVGLAGAGRGLDDLQRGVGSPSVRGRGQRDGAVIAGLRGANSGLVAALDDRVEVGDAARSGRWRSGP